jgi:hypothetical protein
MLKAGGSDDHSSLERLALAEWSGSAAAKVVAVTFVGNRAEVGLLVNDDYEYRAYFQREDSGWRETVTGNGRVIGWSDATLIQWGDDSETSESGSP